MTDIPTQALSVEQLSAAADTIASGRQEQIDTLRDIEAFFRKEYAYEVENMGAGGSSIAAGRWKRFYMTLMYLADDLPELTKQRAPTQAPTDSAVEPAGVSDALTLWHKHAKPFTQGYAVGYDEFVAAIGEARDAARQQLAEMRGAVQNKLPETLLDAAAIADQRDTLLGLVVVAEELLREAPLPSHKAVDEWIARRDHYLREREAPYSDVLKQMSAPPSQPERGKCGGCGNEIDPDTCGCGEPTNGYHDNHTPVPMGCDCYRSTRIEADCAQPEPSPALREAAKAGAEAMRQLILLSQTMAAPYMGRHSDLVEIERFAALLAAFAEGK